MVTRAHPTDMDGPSSRYKPASPFHGQRVLREAILAKVFAPNAPSIVMLQAPAGHGKSTVLRQIRDESRANHVRCAWLNLDEADNDARRHSRHLQRMLRHLLPDDSFVAAPPQAGRAPLQDRANWFLNGLELDESPIALFVDEF